MINKENAPFRNEPCGKRKMTRDSLKAIIAAPRMLPLMLPSPPRTTIASIIAVSYTHLQENLSFTTLNEFLERTRELTPAERDVFKLYGEGYTAQEIAAILYLSINTIKTHSKHIYSKLEVTSREEIILYSNLLNEIGKEIN